MCSVRFHSREILGNAASLTQCGWTDQSVLGRGGNRAEQGRGDPGALRLNAVPMVLDESVGKHCLNLCSLLRFS